MAYLLLLSFDDEEDALNFTEVILDVTPEDPGSLIPKGAKVEAIIKKPTMFCECVSGKKTEKGWTMGQKFGWWVCGQCHKPSRLYWENVLTKHSSFGLNLLDRLFERETKV